jgi:glycerophosphoryl diester phosphodiesterase
MPAAAQALDLQGHRGARGLSPENTLPAFATALSLGVTTLELDVGITRDGVVVVHHDRDLNPDITRGPDGKWLEGRGPAIASLAYEELSRYDVGRLKPGTDYAQRYPAQQSADGARVPRLADLFALARKAGNREVRFNIETKLSPLAPGQTLAPEPFARALLADIRKAGMENRVSIQSFDWRTLALVQKEAPDVPTVYLSARQSWTDNILADAPEGSPWTAGQQFRDHGSVPKMVRAAGGRIWSPFFGELDAAALAEARALGLRVVVWTVNAPEHIRRMLDLGVDGIISDRPDLVRAEMAARGMPLPRPTPVAP